MAELDVREGSRERRPRWTGLDWTITLGKVPIALSMLSIDLVVNCVGVSNNFDYCYND